MNILPLIFTFLLVFSCIAFTFLREVKSSYLAENTFASFEVVERKLNNFIVQKAYKKVKGDPLKKKENASPKNLTEAYVSKRSLFPPLENSKFNIGPLIKHEGDLKFHPLFEFLAEFLRLLYKEKLFNPEHCEKNIEYLLLEAIITKAREHPEIKNLPEMFPEEPALLKIFYKMLKGTNQYSQDKGIPPLGDVIVFRKEASAISLSFASPFLLEALLGRKIALQILQEEQKKWERAHKYIYFSKEDLQALLANNPLLATKCSALEPYIDYSKQIKPRDEIGAKDLKTGLSIKKIYR